MTVLADVRPDAVDLLIRASTTVTLTLEWPTGTLTGRTFTATLDGNPLGLSVAGDTMTVEATDVQTGALTSPAAWLLLEDIDGTNEPVLAGTWTPSNSPRAVDSATVQVTQGAADVDVTVNAATASVLALEAKNQTVEWHTVSAWDQFTVVEVTNNFGTVDLGVDPGGIGTATSTDEDGNDRRIYLLDGFTATDMEARVEFSASTGAVQLGVALRAGSSEAVMCWYNVLFGANASILQGIWEFDGVNLTTNQHDDTLPANRQEIISAEGDGATVTVRSPLPHLLDSTQGIGVRMNFGPYANNDFTVTPTDATTFTFSDTQVFSVTSGTWNLGSIILAANVHRHLAARVAGSEVTFKHWFDGEPEPAWTDPQRAETNPLPATLAGSGGPPPASGGAGLMFGHFGDTGRILRVNDFQVRSLD